MTTSNPTTIAPDAAPYTSVVGLRATFANGQVVQFSGALISPTEVITASHGVWQADMGAAISVVALAEAVPATNATAGAEPAFQNGTYAENYHYNAISDSFDLLDQQASASDYALIHFGTPLVGTAAFTLATSQDQDQQRTSIAGMPFGGPEISSYGYANYKGPGTFDSEISLGSGSSGGPIWTTGADGVLTIIGTVSTPSNAAAQTAASHAQVMGWEGQDASTVVGDTVTGSGGGLYTLTGDSSVLTSQGADTIQADAGTGVIYATGAASILGGSGRLVVVCGAGSDTVRPGSGSATLFGGTGGGILDAGFGGGSVLVAGGGPSTLVGGGNGDALFCAASAPTAAAGGAGQEVIVGGGGPDTMAGGQGTTVAFAGTGADTFVAYEAQHGTLLVVGFAAGDTLDLNTQGGGTVQTTTGGYGTSYTFASGSQVVLYGADRPAGVVVS